MLTRSASTFIIIALCCAVGMAAGETCNIANAPTVAIVPLLLSRETTLDYVQSYMSSILIQQMRPIQHLKTFTMFIKYKLTCSPVSNSIKYQHNSRPCKQQKPH